MPKYSPHKPHAIQSAVVDVGSVTALAALIGVKGPQVISNWSKRGRVPAEYVLRVQAATLGRVTANELSPEVFPERSILVAIEKKRRRL